MYVQNIVDKILPPFLQQEINVTFQQIDARPQAARATQGAV